MPNTINGRTPEEIKKGLECCTEVTNVKCGYCPYYFESPCLSPLAVDTLVYIQQLEARIDTLTAKAVLFDEAVAAGEKMKRERDAAVKALCETHDIFDNHGWTGTPNCMSEARKTINRGLMTFICGGEEVE